MEKELGPEMVAQMKLKLRTTKEGPHTKTTVFIDKQNAGTLVFRGEEYETFEELKQASEYPAHLALSFS